MSLIRRPLMPFPVSGKPAAVERHTPMGADHRIERFTLDGKAVDRVDVKPKSVYALTFSPDGHLLASAWADGRVRVWES